MEYLKFNEKARAHAKERMKVIAKGEEAAKVTKLRDDERERVANWFDAFVGVRVSVAVAARKPQPSIVPLADAAAAAGTSTTSTSTPPAAPRRTRSASTTPPSHPPSQSESDTVASSASR